MRLPRAGCEALRSAIAAKGLRVVPVDLPTIHKVMSAGDGQEITDRILDVINGMMVDMMAAIACKDCGDRRRRQAEDIKKASVAGSYKGRPINEKLHRDIGELVEDGLSIRNIASKLGAHTSAGASTSVFAHGADTPADRKVFV